MTEAMPLEPQKKPLRPSGFINPEALTAYALFALGSALALPFLERAGWWWAAFPLAIASLLLGVAAVVEAAQHQGKAAAVVFGIAVIALTALGVYALVH